MTTLEFISKQLNKAKFNLDKQKQRKGVKQAEIDALEEKKMVYFPFPIDCENCPKVAANIGVCEEFDLLYKGQHPKYSKVQDWEFMCDNCPKEVTEREYVASDEKHIGKTVFLTKEEAEEKLKELNNNA